MMKHIAGEDDAFDGWAIIVASERKQPVSLVILHFDNFRHAMSGPNPHI